MALTEEESQNVIQRLSEVLEALPGDLRSSGWQPHHFLCAISAPAVGADFLFIAACGRLQIPQRIFLPQPRDVFLEGTGSDGADFTPAQKVEAQRLLALPHIIQERVVSDAACRTDRFAETNAEINRVSDLLICLMVVSETASAGKPGGTQEFFERACAAGKPVLELRLTVGDAAPMLEKHWHLPATGPRGWQPPFLPVEAAGLPAPGRSPERLLPTVGEFCSVLKAHGSGEAAKHRRGFTRAAFVIVGTHLLATFLATSVLVLHGLHQRSEDHPGPDWLLVGLLAVELLALAWGLWTHHQLNHSGMAADHASGPPTHRSSLTHAWALARLLAEINRSVSSLGNLHVYPEYLFQLLQFHLPGRFRYLLRTINVLHLVSTRRSSQPWEELRAAYVVERLENQQAYFQAGRNRAERNMKLAKYAFMTCSLAAICFTFLKFLVLAEAWSTDLARNDLFTGALGLLAVILPAGAVGVMSLAAAQAYEAQIHIYGEMADWIPEQQLRIKHAASRQEFRRLVQETELRLLGETAEWYSRRSFTGVA